MLLSLLLINFKYRIIHLNHLTCLKNTVICSESITKQKTIYACLHTGLTPDVSQQYVKVNKAEYKIGLKRDTCVKFWMILPVEKQPLQFSSHRTGLPSLRNSGQCFRDFLP